MFFPEAVCDQCEWENTGASYDYANSYHENQCKKEI
tara:strand:+ start:421 stop:528 length:108 start_codon:yes stop_codon:yes gene_type:complete